MSGLQRGDQSHTQTLMCVGGEPGSKTKRGMIQWVKLPLRCTAGPPGVLQV